MANEYWIAMNKNGLFYQVDNFGNEWALKLVEDIGEATSLDIYKNLDGYSFINYGYQCYLTGNTYEPVSYVKVQAKYSFIGAEEVVA